MPTLGGLIARLTKTAAISSIAAALFRQPKLLLCGVAHFFPRQPALFLHQVALHLAAEGDGAAEAERAEAQEIAHELIKIGRHPYVAPGLFERAEELLPGPEDALSKVFVLLRDTHAVDFTE